ncbi:very-long-chain 3-oxoacyl-CoA reductase-like [Bufo bufo]|uniref:very-long-chain 3-oxoacyl-CoA reductase-like n=1 Tax=Bufo bufo TaxID=8384 RepID=UPI001ABE1F7C|nr:very-long-chain 3-oxoacyl-CoA reductase-like [Bufo bufo]
MEESQFYRWLHLLGLLALSYLVLKQVWTLLIGIKNHILSRWWKTNLKKKYGGWAVVTGATDGIGKAYAMELAMRGFDVVLISRNVEKLQKVAQEIEKQSSQKTKIIQVDFMGGSEIYSKVEKALKDLDIGILVNNVGMTYHRELKRFLEVPDINKMTRIVLPRMVLRKKGLIINISSGAGARPYPMSTMYGATKAFMDFFSRSLHYEYRSDGITVQSVMPLYVSTNMTHNMRTNILVKTSDDYAREALNTVGYSHRTNGCLSHCLQSYILDHLLSETIMTFLIVHFVSDYTINLIIKKLKVK